MADVAVHAGVSHQTVSRVLNKSPLVRDETRARVTASIEAIGYRRNAAARLLATNRSMRIGMISAHLALYGPSTIAVAVQQAGYEAGYEVSLKTIDDLSSASLNATISRLLDEAVEAIVLAIAHASTLERARALELPVPLVLVQTVTQDDSFSAAIDQRVGAMRATEHLLDLGHRRVVHVAGPPDWLEATERRAGWLLAHEKRGILPGAELPGGWSSDSGYLAGLRVAQDPDVTAVFAANDAMALGVMRAIHESGRSVPADISVIGFDDVPDSAHFWPPLTTVVQDFATLGRTAVDLTLRALAGEPAATARLIVPTIAIRASTGPPRTV